MALVTQMYPRVRNPLAIVPITNNCGVNGCILAPSGLRQKIIEAISTTIWITNSDVIETLVPSKRMEYLSYVINLVIIVVVEKNTGDPMPKTTGIQVGRASSLFSVV